MSALSPEIQLLSANYRTAPKKVENSGLLPSPAVIEYVSNTKK